MGKGKQGFGRQDSGMNTPALEKYIHYDWVEVLVEAAEGGWEGLEKGLVSEMWWVQGEGRVRWKVWMERKDGGFWEE